MDLCGHILLLHFLEVKLREDVEPVGDLDDEEELEHEGHAVVWISVPQGCDVHHVLPVDDVSSPEQRDEIEAEKLSRFIKLSVLDLREVELPVDFIQQVLLDDGVHHYGDQEIEEYGGDILKPGGVVDHILSNSGLYFNRYGDIMVQSDENRSKRTAHLEHKSKNEHHRNT